MSKLGKFGALAGAGTGLSQHANSIRELWLQQAQEARADQRQLAAESRADQRQVASEQRQNTEADRREQRRIENDRETQRLRHDFEVDLEGVRHRNTMERDKSPDKREYWRSGDNSYKVENGTTYVLKPGSNQWERVAEPGEAAPLSMDPDELEFQAGEYADNRVKEQAGWFSLDSSDFADYGGSREKAREAYRQEFVAGRTGAPTASAAPQMSPELRDIAARAQAAIQGGASRDAVIQRMKDNGWTDAEISQMGL